MTPQHLHATANLWSLAAALRLLDDAQAAEDRQIAAETASAAEPLRSASWGRRHALGGHGDPTADAAGTIAGPGRVNRWVEVRSDALRQLRDVAQHLPGLDDPMSRLIRTVPHMSDRMAAATAMLAGRIDGRLRRLLGQPDDRTQIPLVRCPACHTPGSLALRGSNPVASDRPAVCRADGCTRAGAPAIWSQAELTAMLEAA